MLTYLLSILWGVLVFGERVRSGWFIALAPVSGLVLTAAVVALGRSPLLTHRSAQAEEGQPTARRRTMHSAER